MSATLFCRDASFSRQRAVPTITIRAGYHLNDSHTSISTVRVLKIVHLASAPNASIGLLVLLSISPHLAFVVCIKYDCAAVCQRYLVPIFSPVVWLDTVGW